MINPSQPDFSNTPICAQRPSFAYGRTCLAEAPSPMVSIVTSLPGPCHLFRETATSVLGQSLQDWEWIVSGHCERCIEKDQRVRFIPDGDVAKSARAPLVLFLRSGDLLEPTALEKLCWFLDSHPEYTRARGYSVEFGETYRLLRDHPDDDHLVMVRKAAMQSDERDHRGGVIPEFLSWRRGAVSPAAGVPSHQRAKPPLKRRLLVLAPHLEIGGADKFNLDMIACLQQNHSYQVSVVTTQSGPHRWRDSFERLTPDVFTLHTFLPVEDYSRFISSFIESRKPDTVLITNSRIAYQLLPGLRTATGPSFVDYLHMDDWSPAGYPRLSLRYASLLDSTIVSSEYLKRRLVEEGGDPKRIHVATTNIDPQLWDRSRYGAPYLRERYGVPDGVPVIAFVGRLCQQKQPDVMAAALKIIRDRGLQFVCLVVGDGEYRPWLENFVKKEQFHQIKLLGALPSEKVREILAISDLFFMPSENEGIALTLFEAMSMGVPTIAAKVGGQDELVSEDCGILIKPDHSQESEYANALERLLRNHELRDSMGSRARKRICDYFTLDKMGNRMAELMESAPRNSFNPESARKDWNGAPQSRRGFRGFVASALLLLSPRHFILKLKNLRLLISIFLDRGKRAQLAGTFDSRYYLSHHPDLNSRGVAPLLHYALQGYLEGRLPSPHFDATGGERVHPGVVVNPMLWSIAQRH